MLPRIALLLLCLGVAPTLYALTDTELTTIRDGFEGRRDAAIQSAAGQPPQIAAKQPPLGKGRPAFVRDWSISITTFALRSCWLKEQLETANSLLLEMCRYYIDNAPERNDSDNFYWSADLLCRTLEFFGKQGSRAPGLITPEVEKAALEVLWLWTDSNSHLADADFSTSHTWFVWDSENHQLQRVTTAWHATRLFLRDPGFADRAFHDGSTPAQHHAAWTAFLKEYLRERARKGLWIEAANGMYGLISLKGLYNVYDFSDDPELKRLTGQSLDLHWADWAQEQLAGVRGGGKSRIYNSGAFTGHDYYWELSWLYLGINRQTPPVGSKLDLLTSSYRMPLVVMDIALDAAGKGVYEVRNRCPGLSVPGYHNKVAEYRLRTDTGGILRYSYCTPEFILGCSLYEPRPLEDWALISSQGRWLGAIVAGSRDLRIVPHCGVQTWDRTYQQHWAVQSKGTLICQRWAPSTGTDLMRVWYAQGFTNRVERDGWIFVEAPGAYAAVRPVAGTYKWEPAGPKDRAGEWLVCSDPDTPLILTLVRKAEVADYETFQHRMVALPVSFDGKVLIHTSWYGDTLRFFADRSAAPQINGAPIDYAPPRTFDSPFLHSDWNSGVVTVSKGERRLTLDFNDRQP